MLSDNSDGERQILYVLTYGILKKPKPKETERRMVVARGLEIR